MKLNLHTRDAGVSRYTVLGIPSWRGWNFDLVDWLVCAADNWSVVLNSDSCHQGNGEKKKEMIKIFLLRTRLLYLLSWSHSLSIFAGRDETGDLKEVGRGDIGREMMRKYYIVEIDASAVPQKRTNVPPRATLFQSRWGPGVPIDMLQFLVPSFILALAFAVLTVKKYFIVWGSANISEDKSSVVIANYWLTGWWSLYGERVPR